MGIPMAVHKGCHQDFGLSIFQFDSHQAHLKRGVGEVKFLTFFERRRARVYCDDLFSASGTMEILDHIPMTLLNPATEMGAFGQDESE